MTVVEQIDALIRETGAADARAAVAAKARELLQQHCSLFGESQRPPDLNVLASIRGIRRSDEPPTFSPDAELVPEPDGGVSMRVNRDRPESRQRFSVAHEISHTFFPGYAQKVQCRPDPRHRDSENPDDLLEMLCDAGAAELLFPDPWFSTDAATVSTAAELFALAGRFGASREATLRRFAATSPRSVAAIFLTWKLKPTQQGVVGRPEQTNMFGVTPEEEVRAALRLRIEYAIPSPKFEAAGHFLPRDKSIDNDGPIHQAATSGQPCDGEGHLDLGQAAGSYHILALPLWTPDEERGPGGENVVAAIICPLKVRKPKAKARAAGPSLFGA